MAVGQTWTDHTLMPFGKYKGHKMRNIPAAYLLGLYDNMKLYGGLRFYITSVVDTLRKDVKSVNREISR